MTTVALLVLFFFPLLWISQYNYPEGDDFGAFFHAQTLGPFGATRWLYFNWTGRYTAFFLQTLFSRFDAWLTAYKIIPVIVLFFGFACLVYFTRGFLGPGIRRTDSFSFAALLNIFVVSLTPDPATAFYCLSTSILYSCAVFATLLIFGLWIRLERAARGSTRVALTVIIALLIALLAGLNELSTILFIATLGLINCHHVIHHRRFHRRGMFFLAVSLAFGLLSFLAPGNSVRASQLPQTGWLQTLPPAAGLNISLWVELITTTALLPASALYLAFLQANRERLGQLSSLLSDVRWYWIMAFIFCVFILLNLVVLRTLGMQTHLPRVKNLFVYNMALAWFFLVTVLFVNLASRLRNVKMPRWVLALLSAAVGLYLVTGFGFGLGPNNPPPSANGRPEFPGFPPGIRTKSPYTNAYLDLISGRAAAYATQNEETFGRLERANGECVQLPTLAAVPRTIVIDVKYPSTWCPKKYAREVGRSLP